MSEVFRHSKSTLGDRLVLLAIADCVDDHGRCWPAISKIAEKAHLSIRQVQRAIQRLAEMGELKIDRIPGRSNIFKLMPQGGDIHVRGDKLSGVTPMSPGGDKSCINRPSSSPPDPPNNSRNHQESSVVHPKKRKDRPFSAQEAIAYCEELGLPGSDGQVFWDKEVGCGWKNNGKPIKDWKATIRAWKGQGYMPSQKRDKGEPPKFARL